VARALRALAPWLLTAVFGLLIGASVWDALDHERAGHRLEWRHPLAFALAAAAILIGWIGFHLRRNRGAAMAFTQVGELKKAGPGPVAAIARLPVMLRMLGVVAIAVALARPQTYHTVTRDLDSIDIMIVLDLSKSMEETDLYMNRLDAAQRVVREFVKKRTGDRVGLVIFANGSMLQCPLTADMKALDQIVADLAIGDVPEQGTAIGDGLALGLAELRRAKSTSRIVVLLSDGDNNVSMHYEPWQAADTAAAMKVKVFTVLVGADSQYGSDVNPGTLQQIATRTGGQFFRATGAESLESSFQDVRKTLEKTKRTISERKLDQDLYWPMLAFAAILLGLELVLIHTRFRRFP
jgi:Ca-activated chloride channel family protein